jgi:hypothetical protein
MWEKPTTYAVIKVGGKRAKSIHPTKAEAQADLDTAGKGYEIQVRNGERTRCSSYCPVNQWCEQYQKYVAENSITEEPV